jgi:hypothetical protein
MAQNKLSDLNNHLFAQLERLGDEDLTPEELKLELERSKAISLISKDIVANAALNLEATKFAAEHLPQNQKLPEQFQIQQHN